MMTTALCSVSRARLKPAADAGGYSLRELSKSLRKGEAALWHSGGMTVTTEVGQDNVCDARLGGGKMTFKDMRTIEQMIMSAPCHRDVVKYRIWGRKGWMRVFPHWKFCGMEDGLAVLEREA